MLPNAQVAEKRDMQSYSLDVQSIFSTIQGEGPFCGHPAIFVRLAGCNLQCPGCDTDYTTGRTRYFIDDIVHLVENVRIESGSTANLVVITGGEPFRQNIAPLIFDLINEDYKVQVETNGTMAIPPNLSTSIVNDKLTIVCSPKAAKIHPTVAARADCFKYVMKADSVRKEDGLPLQALDHKATPYIARPPKGFPGIIYLQPMDEQSHHKNMENVKVVVNNCKEHNYVVQLQIHKLLGVE